VSNVGKKEKAILARIADDLTFLNRIRVLRADGDSLYSKNSHLTRRDSRHNSFDVGVMFLADLGLPLVGNMLPVVTI